MNLGALMSSNMSNSKKILQTLNSAESSSKLGAFGEQLQSLVNQSGPVGNALSTKMGEGEFLNKLKDLFGSLKQLLQSLPKDVLKLEESMLTSLEQSGLWEKLSQDLKDSMKQLFNGETTINELIQKESDLKVPQNMLALFAWFQTSNLQETKNLQAQQLSSEMKQLIQSMDLSAKKDNQPVHGWKQAIFFTQETKSTITSEGVQLTDQQKNQLREMAMKLQTTFEKMSQLSQPHSSEITKLEKQMFELAKQWLQLEKQSNVSAKDRSQLLQALKEQGISQKGSQIWDKVLTNLQKRQTFSSMNHYGTDAKVTYKEFSKWMQNAWKNMNATSQSKQDVSTQQSITASLDTMPMSKQEQYVIKMNTNQQEANTQRQLIDQFQKVMNRSRFLSNQNGQQLSIKLKPGNLGEMMVRMTQQNGEMMVKIMVTSQTTKEMLEGNLQQLRHMFSPNQVVVEKQDLNVNSQQNMHFQKEQDEYSEEQHDPQSTQEDNEHEQHDEETESLDFHELLMNEKV
ncbi:flagellar hook-length control protein FliK [Pontibacillus marinus]|uniref:Flagellar hook-length control protein-like C-terminal domain-containing protein n=1 Tax=Pontibacillus marinus BH030004 = DSM 16465 TaxID=1385511 RepID=A0A0A5G687_9BACI|nr:flagellar hook-length control protein FliK [Pontibacillus marinus]KGX88636.1 hypothetical protein N783_08380 [Pontibacillus marinus BH030004 = DSM 16465]